MASAHLDQNRQQPAPAAHSSTLFQQAMRQLTGGVTLVTTNHEGINIGLTATAVCSLSAAPPRLLTCVNARGATYRALSASRRMCVNILAVDHCDLARRFAGMTDRGDADMFAMGDWSLSADAPPRLVDALASFDCEIDMIMETTSHGVVIGDIKEIVVGAGRPSLLYGNGQFQIPNDIVAG
ncbi:MAG: flavin reductase [Sphingomonadaceae bacterium]|nr:flavin reductase [Sphingomonadaceae bacterium]